MKTDSHPARFWHRSAQNLRVRLNIAFVLQRFLPSLLGLSFILGCLLLFSRKTETSQTPLWIGFGIVVLISLTFSAWKARSRFYSLNDALVSLEVRLKLHNSLSAARAGYTHWPEPRPIPRFYQWSWQRLLLPPFAAAAFLLLAGWIPMHRENPAPPLTPQEPIAWQQVESWAEVLEEQDLFEETTLANWREQVETLRDQPVQDWYTHSSLEAGDNLRDTAADSIRQMRSALDQASYPLTLARESLDQMPSGLQPLLEQHWQEALSQLQSGTLKLDRSALAQLQEVDFSNLQSLSAEQIDRLNQMLREGQSACEHALGGECNNPGDPCATCPGGVCQGAGGISRGPGPADLTFREFPSLIDSERRESVSNQDLSRAALGEQLGTTQTAPEIDPDLPQGPLAAGNANLSSDGGEAVFHSRLTPEEQKRLQQFFR